jgi:Glycosyl transferase family 11
MIVVKLAGGMGNQMFQYAAGRHLAEKHQTSLKLDLGFLLDRTPKKDFVYRDYDLSVFNIQEDFARPNEVVNFGKYRRMGRGLHMIRQKINPNLPLFVREDPFRFDRSYFQIPAHAYLEGYWQSEEYFKDIEPIIRKEFSFRDVLDQRGCEMAARIREVASVCVNVRRADYVTIKAAQEHHGVCDMDYFLEAVELVSEKVIKPHFFIFSDDIAWCRNNFRLDYPLTIVTHDYAGKRFGQYLHLMTQCENYIIPNSTFGWWAAWLNPNPDKIVVAPLQWYSNLRMDSRHLVPPEWIRF